MKTCAKIFIIIGMVLGFWMIVPLIIGGITLSKMNSAKSKSEITLWAVLTLIFCSLIGGILLLLCKDEDFAN